MKQMILAELSDFMEADECQVELWDGALIAYLAEHNAMMRGFRLGSYHEKSRIWHACFMMIGTD